MGDIIRESCYISMLLHLGGFKSLIGFNVIGDPSPAMRWVTLFVMSYLVFFAVDLPSYEVGDVICDVLPGIFCCRPPQL